MTTRGAIYLYVRYNSIQLVIVEWGLKGFRLSANLSRLQDSSDSIPITEGYLRCPTSLVPLDWRECLGNKHRTWTWHSPLDAQTYHINEGMKMIHIYIYTWTHTHTHVYIYMVPPELSTSFGVNTVYSPDPQFKRLLCACVCAYFEP